MVLSLIIANFGLDDKYFEEEGYKGIELVKNI